MSGELHPMDTRRRSRSRTPFLRSSCDHENCDYTGDEEHSHQHHHQKKPTAAKPNVQTIAEETVVVTSSSTTPKKRSPNQAKATNQFAMENTATTTKASSSTATTTSTSSTTTTYRSVKRVEGRGNSIASTSTPKGGAEKNFFVDSFAAQFSESGSARAKEVTQNEMNSAFEKSQQQVEETEKKGHDKPKKRSFLGLFSSPQAETPVAKHNNSSDLDTSDHLAYLEYKQAGEYWKKTPKTDYTYSELSPHRRVLAPGVIAMPNMSRRSLENHHERVNYMVDRDPAREEYIRRRYQATNYEQHRQDTARLLYDSGDEYDYNYSSTVKRNGLRYGQQAETASWWWRVWTTIITSITSIWSSSEVDSKTRGDSVYDNYELYYTRYGGAEVKRGFFGSIAHGISSAFLGFFRKIYQIISLVLCWETWILQKDAPNRNKRRGLFFVLLLLGFLSLLGVYYYHNPNESFPPQSFAQFRITLPSMPTVEISRYVNQENFDQLKDQAIEHFESVRDWADDYYAYLKMVSRNMLDEGRKLFRKEEYFERI